MTSNIDRYKKDLEALIERGEELDESLTYEADPQYENALITRARKIPKFAEDFGADPADPKNVETTIRKYLRSLPSFTRTYQAWYSEAMAVIKQILPDRLADFVRHYEKPKSRKELTNENYRIEDFLQGLSVSFGSEIRVARTAAIPHFQQQRAILGSCKARFESSLFEIRQFVQADLLDSELDAAKELSKHTFTRAAGAVTGVALEKHLAQVCDNHAIKITKAKPSINDLNEALKAANVIDVPDWRFIQRLADIRNLCDHNRSAEPTQTQVDEMIDGVAKVTKTIF